MCGVAPTATGSQTPISTFTNAKTAQECLSDCNSNASCQSFIFGMVDSTIKCELFSVPAAQVPTQSSANLVVYDKACSSIPAVQPTTANPQGLANGAAQNQNGGQTSQSGGQTSSSQPTQGQQGANQKQNKRATCGAAPSGSGTAQPIDTPANIASLDACIAACKANASCKSVEFGKLTANGPDVCRFFDVPAAQVPKATDGQSFQVSDVGCA
ncbi:hypothetical protein K458DRAFT_323450 [Lentithecium fluviatile CBS 122367]|uniref:Apple domain-containing protein n=1 Tax=Lentithecium fluviatile CBS 122367 TaxID=1168545 RepID=A0A6G1ICQ0_9PLEO|nr:hypothetical protein K458DRAFT_323450 [Lentithecium fluviatile CBS 122367]